MLQTFGFSVERWDRWTKHPEMTKPTTHPFWRKDTKRVIPKLGDDGPNLMGYSSWVLIWRWWKLNISHLKKHYHYWNLMMFRTSLLNLIYLWIYLLHCIVSYFLHPSIWIIPSSFGESRIHPQGPQTGGAIALLCLDHLVVRGFHGNSGISRNQVMPKEKYNRSCWFDAPSQRILLIIIQNNV